VDSLAPVCIYLEEPHAAALRGPRYYDDIPLVCGGEDTSLLQFRLTAKLIRPVCIDYLRQLPRTGVIGQDTPDRDPFSQSLLFILVYFFYIPRNAALVHQVSFSLSLPVPACSATRASIRCSFGLPYFLVCKRLP
jgi:hypothetical protein